VKGLHKETLAKLVVFNTFLALLLILLTLQDLGDTLLKESETLLNLALILLPFLLLWVIHRHFFTKWDREISPALLRLQKHLEEQRSQSSLSSESPNREEQVMSSKEDP
jgi:hypothetical protein